MNPLLGSEPAPDKVADDKDKRIVQLVSNAPPSDISGLEDFLAVFNSSDTKADISHFRYVIQRRVKRGMGGKFAKGLSTEVTESVEINLNEDLFGLRRWLGAIKQDPSSVMLLNIFKIKEGALASPLIFTEMLKTGKPILVTGADNSIKAQLLSSIDPQFSKIPKDVGNDAQLKTSLLARVQRKKGFIQSMRNLVELDYLPEKIKQKIGDISTGADPSKLSEAEIINLCMLSDIASRYRTVLEQLKTAMENSSLQVPQLMNMFEMLMADIPLNQTIAAFKEFIDEENTDVSKIGGKSQLFGIIFRFISADDGSSHTGRMDRQSRFFKSLNSNFIKHRVRIDPFLWKHCHFLGAVEKVEKKIIEGFKPLYRVLQQTVRAGGEDFPEQTKKQIAVQVYDLISTANKNPAEFKAEAEFVRHSAANRLLSLIHQKNGHSLDMSGYVPEKGKSEIAPDKFMGKFLELPLTIDDLRQAIVKLRPALFLNEIVAAEIQKSTLDVMGQAAKEREKTLRDIYVLNALSELVTYPFHLGDKSLTNFDRICGINVAQNRLGLEISAKPSSDHSIGIFASDNDQPIGKLQNDPAMLRLAYTELIGMQVEKLVKKAVDRKINYLQTTYGSNFFEVIYTNVVSNNNIPLSRTQFATMIKSRQILGNLDAKGWKPGNENEFSDPFFLFLEKRSDLHKKKFDSSILDNFDKNFATVSSEFRQLLNDVKKGAEENPDENNPKVILWSLFKQGIYNLSRNEAKLVFKKSIFFKYLQEMIAKISSENYSTFTSGIVESGIKIFLPWKFSYLQFIGNRFGFIINDQVIKYQLLSSPTDNPEELDEISGLLFQQLNTILDTKDPTPEIKAIKEFGELLEKTNYLWREYSRNLAIALMDRILSETIIKQLEPGRVLAQNLWYLPDSRKLCLGRSAGSSESIPFSRVLQVPENMGNIVKHPKSSSTTIDDFAIQVHKIGQLQDELRTVCGISEDVLDILQNMSHEKGEAPAIAKYEQALTQLSRILNKPLRHIGEKEVQALHTISAQIKQIMLTFSTSASAEKRKVTTRLQAHLQARRSDGHSLRLNFTDDFIIDKTEIKITRKVKRGDEIVKRQKKVEVEVGATYLTLPLKIREAISVHEILSRKKFIVFSPEGHKKKQLQYSMDIIEILLSLRGNALTFFADISALGDDQVEILAKSIKPYNFFNMDTMKPEPIPGMKTTVTMDPLSGRPIPLVAAPGKPQPEGSGEPSPKGGAAPDSGKEAKPK